MFDFDNQRKKRELISDPEEIKVEKFCVKELTGKTTFNPIDDWKLKIFSVKQNKQLEKSYAGLKASLGKFAKQFMLNIKWYTFYAKRYHLWKKAIIYVSNKAIQNKICGFILFLFFLLNSLR